MLNWTVSLIPPAYVKDPERPPEAAWRAELPDGEALCALVWGDGTEPAPYTVLLAFEPAAAPEGADPLPSRFPTVEELHSAVDHILPAGVLLETAGFQSVAPGERPEVYGPAGVGCVQAGIRQGSPAARRSLIHIPHGIGGPRHA